jgi:hypothetical protein
MLFGSSVFFLTGGTYAGVLSLPSIRLAVMEVKPVNKNPPIMNNATYPNVIEAPLVDRPTE